MLPDGLEESLANMSITEDQFKPLTVNQIKKMSTLMDKAIAEVNRKMAEVEKERNAALREMGNHLHESCIISDNEVREPFTAFAVNDVQLSRNVLHRITMAWSELLAIAQSAKSTRTWTLFIWLVAWMESAVP